MEPAPGAELGTLVCRDIVPNTLHAASRHQAQEIDEERAVIINLSEESATPIWSDNKGEQNTSICNRDIEDTTAAKMTHFENSKNDFRKQSDRSLRFWPPPQIFHYASDIDYYRESPISFCTNEEMVHAPTVTSAEAGNDPTTSSGLMSRETLEVVATMMTPDGAISPLKIECPQGNAIGTNNEPQINAAERISLGNGCGYEPVKKKLKECSMADVNSGITACNPMLEACVCENLSTTTSLPDILLEKIQPVYVGDATRQNDEYFQCSAMLEPCPSTPVLCEAYHVPSSENSKLLENDIQNDNFFVNDMGIFSEETVILNSKELHPRVSLNEPPVEDGESRIQSDFISKGKLLVRCKNMANECQKNCEINNVKTLDLDTESKAIPKTKMLSESKNQSNLKTKVKSSEEPLGNAGKLSDDDIEIVFEYGSFATSSTTKTKMRSEDKHQSKIKPKESNELPLAQPGKLSEDSMEIVFESLKATEDPEQPTRQCSLLRRTRRKRAKEVGDYDTDYDDDIQSVRNSRNLRPSEDKHQSKIKPKESNELPLAQPGKLSEDSMEIVFESLKATEDPEQPTRPCSLLRRTRRKRAKEVCDYDTDYDDDIQSVRNSRILRPAKNVSYVELDDENDFAETLHCVDLKAVKIKEEPKEAVGDDLIKPRRSARFLKTDNVVDLHQRVLEDVKIKEEPKEAVCDDLIKPRRSARFLKTNNVVELQQSVLEDVKIKEEPKDGCSDLKRRGRRRKLAKTDSHMELQQSALSDIKIKIEPKESSLSERATRRSVRIAKSELDGNVVANVQRLIDLKKIKCSDKQQKDCNDLQSCPISRGYNGKFKKKVMDLKEDHCRAKISTPCLTTVAKIADSNEALKAADTKCGTIFSLPLKKRKLFEVNASNITDFTLPSNFCEDYDQTRSRISSPPIQESFDELVPTFTEKFVHQSDSVKINKDPKNTKNSEIIITPQLEVDAVSQDFGKKIRFNWNNAKDSKADDDVSPVLSIYPTSESHGGENIKTPDRVVDGIMSTLHGVENSRKLAEPFENRNMFVNRTDYNHYNLHVFDDTINVSSQCEVIPPLMTRCDLRTPLNSSVRDESSEISNFDSVMQDFELSPNTINIVNQTLNLSSQEVIDFVELDSIVPTTPYLPNYTERRHSKKSEKTHATDKNPSVVGIPRSLLRSAFEDEDNESVEIDMQLQANYEHNISLMDEVMGRVYELCSVSSPLKISPNLTHETPNGKSFVEPQARVASADIVSNLFPSQLDATLNPEISFDTAILPGLDLSCQEDFSSNALAREMSSTDNMPLSTPQLASMSFDNADAVKCVQMPAPAISVLPSKPICLEDDLITSPVVSELQDYYYSRIATAPNCPSGLLLPPAEVMEPPASVCSYNVTNYDPPSHYGWAENLNVEPYNPTDFLPSFAATFANVSMFNIDQVISTPISNTDFIDFQDSEKSDKFIMTIGECVSPIPKHIEDSFYMSPTKRYLDLIPFWHHFDLKKMKKAADPEVEFFKQLGRCKDIDDVISKEYQARQRERPLGPDPKWLINFRENLARSENYDQEQLRSPTCRRSLFRDNLSDNDLPVEDKSSGDEWRPPQKKKRRMRKHLAQSKAQNVFVSNNAKKTLITDTKTMINALLNDIIDGVCRGLTWRKSHCKKTTKIVSSTARNHIKKTAFIPRVDRPVAAGGKIEVVSQVVKEKKTGNVLVNKQVVANSKIPASNVLDCGNLKAVASPKTPLQAAPEEWFPGEKARDIGAKAIDKIEVVSRIAEEEEAECAEAAVVNSQVDRNSKFPASNVVNWENLKAVASPKNLLSSDQAVPKEWFPEDAIEAEGIDKTEKVSQIAEVYWGNFKAVVSLKNPASSGQLVSFEWSRFLIKPTVEAASFENFSSSQVRKFAGLQEVLSSQQSSQDESSGSGTSTTGSDSSQDQVVPDFACNDLRR